MHVLKYCCFFDNFFDLGNDKNMKKKKKKTHENPKLLPWFFHESFKIG